MRKCVKQEPFGDTKDPLSPLRTLEEPIFLFMIVCICGTKSKLLHFLKILLNCAGTFFFKKKKRFLRIYFRVCWIVKVFFF